jgi:hypothetical protein
MIDALALRNIADLGQRAEQRQPAVPDVIAASAIVNETDDLVAKLAMLQDTIGNHASEIACARDENSLEADTGAPPALEQLAHGLA